MPIKFGTEGWRAVIAEEFTVENVRIVTQAIADHLLETAGSRAGRRSGHHRGGRGVPGAVGGRRWRLPGTGDRRVWC